MVKIAVAKSSVIAEVVVKVGDFAINFTIDFLTDLLLLATSSYVL